MKPTSDDFKPRRDGYFEHAATWAEVSVGTILMDRRVRTKTWIVTDMSHGVGQIQSGKHLWMRVRCQETGAEYTIPPGSLLGTVVILTRDPADTEPIPPTDPSDTEALLLLIESLGAELMASRDHETGEITCPDYVHDTHIADGDPQPITRGLIEHMRFAHGMAVDGDMTLEAAMGLHHQAHHPTWPNVGKGGFPHRHVPEEDLSKDFVLQRRPLKPLKPTRKKATP